MSDTPVHLFDAEIRRRLPGCTTRLDAPLLVSGAWFLDVIVEDRLVVVQHQPGVYFLGVSKVTPEDPGFTHAPNEVFDALEPAVTRTLEYLTTGSYV